MADPGLFLAHYNRGREFYDQRRLADAERELEEACLLRPRDLRALNLLGLIYFRSHKFDRAEEVYRRLVAESPEDATLYYNLGLVYFKLNRDDEAEMAFLKSLDLADRPKIHFYLGAIYERLQRFQDAIYQYRQAGASVMVRRMEGRIAPAAAPPAAAPPPAARRKKTGKGDDTAEFKSRDVDSAMRKYTPPEIPAAKKLRPVGEALLAQAAPKKSTSDTTPFRAVDDTIPPGSIPLPRPQPAPASGGEVDPGNGFRLLQTNLLQVIFTGKLFIKQGTLYSYSGNLTFWVKDRRPDGTAALVIITGTGKVLLTDKDRSVTFLRVAGEPVAVEPTHLLACEETLSPRYASLGARSLEYVVLEGQGVVALSVAGKPLKVGVTPDFPVSAPMASVITWSGAVSPHLVDDAQLREVILPSGRQAEALVRLEGTGHVLLEQLGD